MSKAHNQFAGLLQRARQGLREAQEKIVQMFAGYVLQVVRHHLDRRVRPIYDSTDVTQEVWKDFFDKTIREHTFATPEDVRAFLAKMAEHKAAALGRTHLETQKGDLRREYVLSALPHGAEQLADPHPGPAEIAAERDEWEHLLLRHNGFLRVVLKLLHEGYSGREIADQMGVSRKTVSRAFREKLFPRPRS